MERPSLPLLKTGMEFRKREEEYSSILHEGGEFQEHSEVHDAEVMITAPLGDESHFRSVREVGRLSVITSVDAFSKSDKGGRIHDGLHYEGTGDYACHMMIRPRLPEELQDTYNNPLIIVNRNVDHLSPPGRIGLQLWQELVLSGNSPLKALEPYIFLFDEHFGQLFPDIAGSVMSAGIDLSSNGKDLRSHFSEDMIRMFYRKESQNWYPEPREMSGHALTLKTLVEQQLAAIRRIYNKTQFELVTSTTNNLHTIQLPYASNPDSVPYWRKKWGEQGKPPLTVQDFFGWCMNGPSVIQVAAGYEHEGELYMSVASSNPMADIYDSVPMLIDPNDRHIVDGNLLLDQVIYELYEAYGKDDYFLLWSLIEKTQLANYGIHAVPVRSRNWYDTDAESQIASRNHTFAKQFHQLKDYNLPITIASSTDGWNHTTRDPALRHTMSLQHESIFADNPQYYDRIQQLFQDQRLTDDATRIISQINLKALIP